MYPSVGPHVDLQHLMASPGMYHAGLGAQGRQSEITLDHV